MKNSTEEILIVGAGEMAIEYAKVLKSMKREFIVVGRRKKSARNFENTVGTAVVAGGIEKWIARQRTIPERAIVAVSEDELGKVTLNLIGYGVRSILVEKPAGLDYEEIEKLASESKDKRAEVFVGYNRRFYASVKKANEIIEEDGRVLSFQFEFTEWSKVIEKLNKPKEVFKNWFLHNSTHVVDLAFYLGGKPRELSTYVRGSLSWHPSGSIFTGAGITNNGSQFSYNANWESPGRWGIELMTREHRLILRPLEKLFIQDIGSIAIEEVNIDDKLDKEFKPGLYNQTKAFLGNKRNLCTIQKQTEMIGIYKKINPVGA